MDEPCSTCGEKAGFDEHDGFFFCKHCDTRVEDVMEFEEENLMEGNPSYHHQNIYRLKHTEVKTETVTLLSQPETQQSSYWRSDVYKTPKEEYNEGDLSIPNDFGGTINVSEITDETLSSEIRMRYVLGIQYMIQFQCKVLVENFGASPLICGLAGVIWMRFVVASRVFDENWAANTLVDSEEQFQGFSQPRITESQRSKGALKYNLYGQSGVMIRFRSLRKKIPLSSSLAVSFLACHVAREPILPTDIHTWTLEGKLPYLTAFIDLEKLLAIPSRACPLSSSIMFKPFRVVGSRELEAHSGFVAQSMGLQLPPVNFFGIARRYLKQLSLPQEKILPHAARIYEWSMPPDLWLSANPKRLPSRVCVMSIIMLTVRLLYNINGFGKWEATLTRPSTSSYGQERNCDDDECSQSFDISMPDETKTLTSKSKKRKSVAKERSQSVDPKGNPDKTKNYPKGPSSNMLRGDDCDFDTTELLCDLEAMYDETQDTHEYLEDLPTYLKYCKDVVFAGLKPLLDNNEEERIIEKLWDFYVCQEDTEAVIGGSNSRRGVSMSEDNTRDECHLSATSAHNAISSKSMHGSQHEDRETPTEQEVETPKGTTLKQMKLNMEQNGFCYIPPRVKLKRFDHLHYIRKNDGGTRSYVAHGDYYILLRACAQVAEVSARYMHAGALKLEKRLSWIENRIDQSLHFKSENHSPKSNIDDDPPEVKSEIFSPKSNIDDDDPPEDIYDSLDLLKCNLS
ncbi:Tata box-binding protein-associated factor rna polymerase i subunit b [Thalictrum thalictroides]|uniref:Tata box-binding protein-associated factor rna polymerase i subunit b n=1 Tax=Thalictrum thalictroides TaxID=46969 RepID=A0A7J6V5Q7_THATH|nr:Tata box-binding protein-associated factor rna polymerase i subunit b [Thalictrum thalictroides]